MLRDGGLQRRHLQLERFHRIKNVLRQRVHFLLFFYALALIIQRPGGAD